MKIAINIISLDEDKKVNNIKFIKRIQPGLGLKLAKMVCDNVYNGVSGTVSLNISHKDICDVATYINENFIDCGCLGMKYSISITVSPWYFLGFIDTTYLSPVYELTVFSISYNEGYKAFTFLEV